MPRQPGHDHPDDQQLAAFEAGELGRRERARLEAHLGACADCAALLTAAEQASHLLAALPLEPELPPGLHQRLSAAVERELATTGNGEAAAARGQLVGEPEQEARRMPPSRRSRPSRQGRAPAWYRRRGALGLLGAAAALLLLVALVPQLHLGGSRKAATSAASGAAHPASGAAPLAGAAGPGSLTHALAAINAPGGFSAQDLRARLASDSSVRAAFSAAARSVAPAPGSAGPKSASPPQAEAGSSTATAPPAGPLEGSTGNKALTVRAGCVAAATRLAPGSRPALLVTTVYQGRPATVLVTVTPGSSGATVPATIGWFAGGTCAGQPIHQEETTVTLP